MPVDQSGHQSRQKNYKGFQKQKRYGANSQQNARYTYLRLEHADHFPQQCANTAPKGSPIQKAYRNAYCREHPKKQPEDSFGKRLALPKELSATDHPVGDETGRYHRKQQ